MTDSRAPLPPIASPEEADGDELRFCATCAFAPVCLPEGFNKPALAELHCLIEHIGPFEAGSVVFREREPFDAIYAVRAGAIKTCVGDDEGREQVLGFYLPGELVGLNGVYPAHYPCRAVTLDTTTLCRFSFPALATLATRMPGIQTQLFRLMSKDIGAASLLGGDFSADERLAAFLIGLSDRYAARGFSPIRYRLVMTRADIANYLRLATETVSRVLRRFQDDALIEVDRREIELRDAARLRHLARHMLRN
jgi:CRP/FNR family transcriptional regulator